MKEILSNLLRVDLDEMNMSTLSARIRVYIRHITENNPQKFIILSVNSDLTLDECKEFLNELLIQKLEYLIRHYIDIKKELLNEVTCYALNNCLKKQLTECMTNNSLLLLIIRSSSLPIKHDVDETYSTSLLPLFEGLDEYDLYQFVFLNIDEFNSSFESWIAYFAQKNIVLFARFVLENKDYKYLSNCIFKDGPWFLFSVIQRSEYGVEPLLLKIWQCIIDNTIPHLMGGVIQSDEGAMERVLIFLEKLTNYCQEDDVIRLKIGEVCHTFLSDIIHKLATAMSSEDVNITWAQFRSYMKITHCYIQYRVSDQPISCDNIMASLEIMKCILQSFQRSMVPLSLVHPPLTIKKSGDSDLDILDLVLKFDPEAMKKQEEDNTLKNEMMDGLSGDSTLCRFLAYYLSQVPAKEHESSSKKIKEEWSVFISLYEKNDYFKRLLVNTLIHHEMTKFSLANEVLKASKTSSDDMKLIQTQIKSRGLSVEERKKPVPDPLLPLPGYLATSIIVSNPIVSNPTKKKSIFPSFSRFWRGSSSSVETVSSNQERRSLI